MPGSNKKKSATQVYNKTIVDSLITEGSSSDGLQEKEAVKNILLLKNEVTRLDKKSNELEIEREQYRKKRDNLRQEIQSIATEIVEYRNDIFISEKLLSEHQFELQRIKDRHREVKLLIKKLKNNLQEESYYLNKDKVELQRQKNPQFYRGYSFYLVITTLAGILLAFYYFLVFSKG